VFLSGRDDIDVREKWRHECNKRNDVCLIATYGIFQMGINIPNLKYIVLAAPFKAKIRILQSIGRALRKHVDKETGALIFDITDQVKFFGKYGIIRIRYYDAEDFEVKEIVLHEGDPLTLDRLLN
jgi:superfamily II DNA or RNA helicase